MPTSTHPQTLIYGDTQKGPRVGGRPPGPRGSLVLSFFRFTKLSRRAGKRPEASGEVAPGWAGSSHRQLKPQVCPSLLPSSGPSPPGASRPGLSGLCLWRGEDVRMRQNQLYRPPVGIREASMRHGPSCLTRRARASGRGAGHCPGAGHTGH